MLTYYICLSSILCWTGMASHSYMLQLHNHFHYICAYRIYRTNVLFMQRNFWECTMFRNCHPFFDSFSRPAVKGRGFSIKMHWVFMLLDPVWENKLTRNNLYEIILFYVLIVLNVDFCQWPAKVIQIISNQPNSVPFLTHRHQSSW